MFSRLLTSLVVFLAIILQLLIGSVVEGANEAINNRTLEDWLIVDLPGSNTYKPIYIKNHSMVPHDDISHWTAPTYFWQAPQVYHQWKVYTYGGNLTFFINHIVTRGDTSGTYVEEPNLVLEGGPVDHHMKIGNKLLRDKDIKNSDGKNQTVVLPLSEPDWFYLEDYEDPDTRIKSLRFSDVPVSRADFSLILAGLDRILVRAKYHMDQAEGNLFDVKMGLKNNKSRTIECDNDCSGILLDDLDDIGLLMDLIRSLAPGLKDGPWRRLAWLDEQARSLNASLADYLKLIKLGQQVIDNSTLDSGLLELRANNLDSRAPILSADAYLTQVLAKKILDETLNLLWSHIDDIIKMLTERGFGQGGVSPDKIESILEESKRILIELRGRNLAQPVSDAERQYQKAKSLLERIKLLLIDPKKSLELIERLKKLHGLLLDFAKILQKQVKEPVLAANELVFEGNKRYQMLLNQLSESEKQAAEARRNLDEANRLLELTKKCLADEAAYLDLLPRQLNEVNNSLHEIEIKRSILTQINPEYQTKYVDRCRDHKDALVKKARELDGLFNATRDVADYAVRAANVYKNIILAINAAEEAAKKASDAAQNAYKKTVPDFDESLADKAREAKRKSLELLEKAKSLRDQEMQRLGLELEKRKQIIERLMEVVKRLFKDLDAIRSGLKQLADKNLMAQLLELDAYLRQLLERIDKIHKRLSLLGDLIYNSIIPEYNRLSAGSQSSLGNVSQVIEIANSNLLASIRLASSAKANLEKLLKMEQKLDIDLDLLRRKIQLAHQEASSAHPSIMPSALNGLCARSYFVPSSLSGQIGGISVSGFNIHHISLTWSLHNEDQESLLLYIGSKNHPLDDFLAIEMYERRISVVYNLRSYSPTGVQRLTHPLLINFNDKNLLSDEAWYQITLSMASDELLRLSVKAFGLKFDSNTNADSVTQRLNLNPMGLSKLQTSPYGEADIDFYVGGLPQINPESPDLSQSTLRGLRSSRLTGCLYDLSLNRQQIGLWNFKTNQGCDACMEGPSETRDTSVFSFTGQQSYASINQIKPYDKTRYLVSLSVRTTDENGLIFLTLSEALGHYLAIVIKQGRVNLIIGNMNYQHHSTYLGSSLFEPALAAHLQALKVVQPNNETTNQQQLIEHSIITSQEYNNGQWFKITAEKDQNRTVLVVNDEYKESILDDRLYNLDMDRVFFGGVWPLVRPKRYSNTKLLFNSCACCLKDIQIETNSVDLLKRQSYGVETGCPEYHSKRSYIMGSSNIKYPLPFGK